MATAVSITKLRRTLCITTALCGSMLLAAPLAAQTAPTGPTFPAGTPPTINSTTLPDTSVHLEILTNANRSVINWQSFSIGLNDSVTFSNGSTVLGDRVAVLNRVVGNGVSIPQSFIDGKLTSASNISVFLLNPTGIVFGPNANVNVGGLVASTLDLDNGDFTDGDDSFHFFPDPDGSDGIVLNSGARIDTLAGGDRIAAFIGHFVTQNGAVGVRADGTDSTLATPDAVFVAASEVTMVARPNSPLALTLNAGTAFDTTNSPLVVGGTVNGRNVYIGLATASAITDAVLNVSGVVTATTASATDRGIVLAAGTSSKLIPDSVDPLILTGIAVAPGANGNAGITIGGSLTALDGGTPANTADVEIRARSTNINIDTIGGSGSVSADDQVLIQSLGRNINLSGAISADYDVALDSQTSIATAGITAGDDVVLRAGTTIGTGALSAGGVERTPAGNRPDGEGDLLAQATFPTADLTGGGYVLATATGNIQTGTIASDYDVAIRTDGSITTQAIGAGDDVVLRAGTSIGTGAVTAGGIERTSAGNRPNGVGDLLAASLLAGADLTSGGSLLADSGTDSVLGGTVSADFDVAVRAAGSLSAQAIGAGDDVVLRSGGNIITGGIVAGGTERSVGDRGNGAADRLAAGLLPGISLTGGGNLLGDADGTIFAGAAVAADVDVALRAGGTLTTLAQSARDDIVLRGGGAVSTGALTSGSAASDDREGSGDALASAALLAGEAAADPLDGNDVNAGGSSILVASARTGSAAPASVGMLSDLRLTASAGQLELGTGNSGGRAQLDKRGTVGELQVTDLSAGEAAGAAGDALLVSATSVRAGSVRSAGGSIDIRAGEQAGAATPGAIASTPVRDGSVTGLAGASNGIAQNFGRANLAAVAATGGSGSGSVAVTAGGLVQLGSVQAGQDISVTAGSASIADRDGAIDISSAAASNGALILTAFNDDPAKAKDIRLGARSIRDGGGVETGFTTDETAADSSAGAGVTLTTSGTRGDIIVARNLTAGGVSEGTVMITSVEDAHLSSGAFRIESLSGDIDVQAAIDVTGIVPASAAERSGADGLVIGSLTSGAGIDLDSPGDIRIGSATSTGGDIDVDAGGSVTGLALAAAASPAGANLTASRPPSGDSGRDVTVVAGGLARLGTVEATRDIDVDAGAISIESANAGRSVSLTATGVGAGAPPAPVNLTSLTDSLAAGYGFADLTAADLGDSRDKRITVDAGQVAQLGSVRAGGPAGAAESTTPTSLIRVDARALTVRSAEAVSGRIELTASHGGLYLGTGRAGTTAVLIKRDDDSDGLTAAERDRDELRVTGALTTGAATGAAGDQTIRTLTHARLGLLEARGGSIDVRAGADAAGTPVQDGDVTGLRTPAGSNGMDGDHGRADLRAVAATGASGPGSGSVTVEAGGLVQLGAVSAGQNISVTAGSSSIAARDGAIDISSAVAANGALDLFAFNDSADPARDSDIRLGTVVSERTSAEEEGASDPAALDSSAGTYVRIETQGTRTGSGGTALRNDVVVGRSLTANGALGGGTLTLIAQRDVRLAAAPHRIGSTNDDVTITAGRMVTGLARSDDGLLAAATANGGELRAGSVTGVGDIRIVGGGAPAGDSASIAGPGNVRLREVTSTTGNIAVDAGGSVTGLGTADPGDPILRAGEIFAGRDVSVGAGSAARLSSIDAVRDIAVTAPIVAVGAADSGRDLSLVASGAGLHLGTGDSGGTTLLRTSQAGNAVDPQAGPLDDPASADLDRVDIGHGAANLLARDDADQRNRTVRVSAGLSTPGVVSLGAAQLGTVRAGTAASPELASANPAITVTADRLSVGDATAVNGELRLTAREGPLYLGIGSSGAQALLDKRGAGNFAGNELRIRNRLTVGTGTPAGATIVTATDARLGTIVAQGGAIDIRAGEDIADSDIARDPDGSFTVVRRPTRDGDVTGLGLAAPAASPRLDSTRGRAILTADTSVDVRAGGLVQAGAVAAGTSIRVEAGTPAIADRDGAIDISSAVARGGSLSLTAYNDDPTKAADVRLGTVARAGGAESDPAAADSDASTTASLVTTGSRGDVVVGRSLRASGNVTLASVADVRLGADPNEVRSRTADILVNAARDVTGLVPGGSGTGGAGANGGELNAGAMTSGGDLLVDGRGNVRLGSATSTGGSVTVGADGSVTGQRASAPVTGAGRLFAAGNVAVTAGPGSSGWDSVARTSTIAAGTTDGGATASASGGNVTVTGDLVAVESVRARQGSAAPSSGGDVTLTARRSGLHAGTIQADRRLTLTTGAAGTLASPTAGDLLAPTGATRDVLDVDHGQANLNAATSVVVTAGRSGPGAAPIGAAQLGDVRGGNAVTVVADRMTVAAATATTGALQLTAREGPLFLGDGSAGTTATLTKNGADSGTSNPVGNELRVRGTLRAGTAAGSAGDVRIASDSDARLTVVIARNGSVEVNAARDVTGIRLAADATGRGGSLAHGGAVLRTGESAGSPSGLDVVVNAGELAQLDSVAAGRAVNIASNSIELIGAVAAPAVTLTNRPLRSNPTRLGGTGTANDVRLANGAGVDSLHFVLRQDEINRISANQLTIASGVQNVEMQGLALSADAGRNDLRILTTGRIDVVGTVSAVGSLDTRTIRLGGSTGEANAQDPATLASVIAIAAESSGGGRLLAGDANLDLRGVYIGLGQAAFLGQIGLAPGSSPQPNGTINNVYIGNPNSTLYRAPAPYSDRIVLTANRLTVTYGQYALFQNTAPPLSEPSGVDIGGLNVLRTLALGSSGETAPNGFAIFGRINDRGGNNAALLGPEVIPLENVNRSNTRINGCLIGSGGGCLITAFGTPPLNEFDESDANILQSAEELEERFSPIVGTNNEALFTGVDEADEPAFDCESDPDNPQCPAASPDQGAQQDDSQ